ncbi:N(1)-aminopropylagmatine ureohydrolase [Candidatus Anstonella stagnisolia]|nr:N(1)-aminopropylagmatine ureohydrolase [Candidatus Anstonella stagnisolia]
MKIFHENLPFTFGGVENDFARAKAGVLQVPYDGTASYKVGMRHGPAAVIDASRNMELYDIEFGCDISQKVGFYTYDELHTDKGSPQKTVKIVEESVAEVLKAGKLPIVLGGEHSISSGAIKACKEKYGQLSVLQIDAHADMRDEYEGTKYNHACIMRRAREITPDCMQVGIRSMSEEEAEYIKEKKLGGSIFGPKFDAKKVAGMLKGNVYITVDVDGFDPAYVPGTGTPEPNGINWEQAMELFSLIKGKIVGFDVVEVMPLAGQARTEFFCAKLAYKMAGYALLKK